MTAIKPQYIGGFALLFWGYQTDLIWFALPMAIIFEAQFFFNRRWALTKTDFYRVADLTSVSLVLMVIFLFMNRREYHFITTLIAWLPLLIYPLTVLFSYSTTDRMRLDVMFYSLRRQREPVQQSWDMDYVLLGSCILAAGMNREGFYYFPIVAGITIFCLYKLRSSRFSLSACILTLSIVILGATALHTGIRGAHLAVKAKTEQWIADWISRRTDPLKTRTALGQVGKLKLSDAIDFRIEPLSGEPDFPRLLREAAYNAPTATNWGIVEPNQKIVEPIDDFTWSFVENAPGLSPEAKIYIEFQRERSLIPVPGELTELSELPANEIQRTDLGTILAYGLIPAPHYRSQYQNVGFLGKPPTDADLFVPGVYTDYLSSIAPTDVDAETGLRFVQNFFSDFRYTLYQSGEEIQDNPLVHFMSTRKAGHCEYFASATALLLRATGIPSRYVVGFAVQEWNDDLKMYVVRKRHAHAWTIAYINDQWVTVDTTPSQWLEMEEHNSSALQPLWDYLGNNRFLFLRWWNEQTLEDYERELYIIGFILALILIWRISTSEQVIIGDEEEAEVDSWIVPGAESPFFRIESQLSEMGFRRSPGELMGNWILRIERPELLPLLTSHNRWRFDPLGISITERQILADQVREWLVANDPEPEQASV